MSEALDKPRDLKPVGCPRFCFQGHHGGDWCNTCGGTGSGFRVRKAFYPNNRTGYIDACAAAGIEPVLED